MMKFILSYLVIGAIFAITISTYGNSEGALRFFSLIAVTFAFGFLLLEYLESKFL